MAEKIVVRGMASDGYEEFCTASEEFEFDPGFDIEAFADAICDRWDRSGAYDRVFWEYA